MSTEKTPATCCSTVVLIFATLAGCSGEPQTEAAGPATRPVKTLLIAGAGTGGVRNFPARIDAAQRAELSFRVAGTVQELLVREGDRLTAGQPVAKLDPKDFQIVVNDRQATFDNAKKNYERGKGLVATGAIARVDFDQLEALFKTARAALDAAQQDLNYTLLAAPFAGQVAKRHVEQFEEVQAKQPIATLQNVETLDVKFDVPELIVRSIRGAQGGETGARDRVKIHATFNDLPGKQFPLTFKEAATKADPQTQTFEVTYAMRQPDFGMILAGMTANVVVDLSAVIDENMVFTVPVSAVVGDYKLDPHVWTVDQQAMTVAPRSVQVGRMLGDRIEILEGLDPGTRIVTAGAPFLTEGMQVTLMPDLEQAQPRPEDLKYQ